MGNEVKRRDFIMGAAMGTVGLMSQGFLFGCSPASNETAEGQSDGTSSSGATDEKLSLEEVERLRQELIDSKTEYVKADGTVVPEVYVKLRTLINSLGVGMNCEVTDTSFDFMSRLFSEEEAQQYLEMPRGCFFTAEHYADDTDRSEEECLEICDTLASRNLLFRARRAGVSHFHIIPVLHGIYEYNLQDFSVEWLTDLVGVLGKDQEGWGNYTGSVWGADTPFYYAVPANNEVVAEDEIMIYDDIEAIIKRHSTLAVAPCQCRLNRQITGRLPYEGYLDDYPLDTCIATGEEAEFYIENGMARPITQEEALDIIHHSVNDTNMILQHGHTKASEIICSCHAATCGPLGDVKYITTAEEGLISDDQLNAFNDTFKNISHYDLHVDKEACIKCGSCVDRCPMLTVELGDDGYPVIGPSCVRCGVCGVQCPAKARVLHLKDEYPELPNDMIEDINAKSEVRFRKGRMY